ncbi:MAG: DUF4376 domain-containing protein [Pseudomonadota bacterium]|nr:DUF4376 domain-containing protein [Pseudomonadota bacterium]
MIAEAKYTEDGNILAVINGEAMFVPDDPTNSHRQMIAEWEAEGNTIPAYVTPPITSHEVDAERDRRIDAGFTFGGVLYQSRPEDRENIAGAATAALGAMVNGAQAGDLRWHGGNSDFVWIAADNSTHTMDAQTVFNFGQAAMQHKQMHIFAGRALKETSPIPADFSDDSHWP